QSLAMSHSPLPKLCAYVLGLGYITASTVRGSSEPMNLATGSATPPRIMPTRSFPAGAISEDRLWPNTAEIKSADSTIDNKIRRVKTPRPHTSASDFSSNLLGRADRLRSLRVFCV